MALGYAQWSDGNWHTDSGLSWPTSTCAWVISDSSRDMIKLTDPPRLHRTLSQIVVVTGCSDSRLELKHDVVSPLVTASQVAGPVLV